MESRRSPIERAFELAKSGKVKTVADILSLLKSEHHSVGQIVGPTLNKQHREAIKEAKPDEGPGDKP